MTTVQVELSRHALLQAIKQFDRDELSTFVDDILALRAQSRAPVLGRDETELFQRINRWLSAEGQARRAILLEKLEDETLTEAEHAELLRLNEQAEMLNAQRIEALSQLATLRLTTLPQVMRDLGVGSA